MRQSTLLKVATLGLAALIGTQSVSAQELDRPTNTAAAPNSGLVVRVDQNGHRDVFAVNPANPVRDVRSAEALAASNELNASHRINVNAASELDRTSSQPAWYFYGNFGYGQPSYPYGNGYGYGPGYGYGNDFYYNHYYSYYAYPYQSYYYPTYWYQYNQCYYYYYYRY